MQPKFFGANHRSALDTPALGIPVLPVFLKARLGAATSSKKNADGQDPDYLRIGLVAHIVYARRLLFLA